MMTDLFRIILVVGVLVYIGIIAALMKKGRMSLKYSLLWLLSGLIFLIVALFPQLIRGISHLVGVYSEMNLLFFIGICFLLLIIISLTSIASLQNDKIRGLTQTQAMLEKRVRELEEIVKKGE